MRSAHQKAVESFAFADDGAVPNSHLPLVVLRGAVTPGAGDPAAAFERVFAVNGWTGAWRNGIYDFHHYQSTAHEVLGVARGSAAVRFGGEKGETVTVAAGDVVVIPAGVAHARLKSSDDFFVVGAYAGERTYDIVRGDGQGIAQARQRIAEVPLPDADPVVGADGPLVKLWR